MNQLLVAVIFSAVTYCVTAQTQQCLAKRFGEEGGPTEFDDLVDYETAGNLTGVRVWHAEFIHGLQFRYGGVWTSVHGSNGNEGALSEFVISGQVADAIDTVNVRHGIYIDEIEFVLKNGDTYGPYGGRGGVFDSVTPVCGHVYFKGATGNYVNLLSVYTDCSWCSY